MNTTGYIYPVLTSALPLHCDYCSRFLLASSASPCSVTRLTSWLRHLRLTQLARCLLFQCIAVSEKHRFDFSCISGSKLPRRNLHSGTTSIFTHTRRRQQANDAPSEGIVFAYSSRDVPQGPTSSRGRSSTIHARERRSKRGWEPVFPGFFARSFTCVVPGAHHADFMQIQFLHLARHLPVGVVECGWKWTSFQSGDFVLGASTLKYKKNRSGASSIQLYTEKEDNGPVVWAVSDEVKMSNESPNEETPKKKERTSSKSRSAVANQTSILGRYNQLCSSLFSWLGFSAC